MVLAAKPMPRGRHVPFQEGGHVSLSPDHAVVVGRREIRRGKAAPQPQAREVLGLECGERRQFQVRDPARQRLGGLADQLAGRTAEDQVPLVQGFPIDQHPQQREQLGTALDLVDDDQTFQRFQGELRVRQPVEVPGVFQIEVMHLPFGKRGDVVTRQRRLATLARAEYPDHGVAPEQCPDVFQENGPVHLTTLKIENGIFDFQGCIGASQRGEGPVMEPSRGMFAWKHHRVVRDSCRSAGRA